MPIEFACPECARRLRVPDGSAGKHCMCPGCQVVVPIPLATPHAPQQVTQAVDPNRAQLLPAGKIEVACPQCQHILICDSKLEGTRGLCLSCKAVFVISTNPVQKTIDQASFVFACPKCKQLHNGKPEMEGRKGKCVSCNSIFVIREQSNPAVPSPQPSSNATVSDKQSKTPKPVPSPQKNRPVQPSPQARTAPANTQTVGPTIIQPNAVLAEEHLTIACPSCDTHLQAPASFAGKTVQCSNCRSQMVVPHSDIEPPTEAASVANSNLWGNDLFSALPAADPFAYAAQPQGKKSRQQASTNPYAPPSVGFGHDSGLTGSSDEQIRKKHLSHEASIRSFGLLYIIGVVLECIAAVIYFLAAVAQFLGGQQVVFAMFFVALSLVVAGLAVLQYQVAIGLRKFSNFGRIGGTVFGTIGLLGFPIGTLINGYLLYLLWSDKGNVVFSPRYQRVIQATPHIVYKTHIVVKILLILLLLVFVLSIVAVVVGSFRR